jgi:hypothetical protein
MKPVLVNHWEEVIITSQGYEISLRMRLWQFSNQQSLDFPEGYKFSWIAYNVVSPQQEFVLFDNHKGKPPHYHIDDKKKYIFFTWTSRERAEKLFWQKVQARFGYFSLDTLE